MKPELFSAAGGNKFASMFSERWPSELDQEGRFFVDYSPQVFMPLIEFLRLARDSEPGAFAPVVVDPPYRRAWIRMMLASSFHPKVLRQAGVAVSPAPLKAWPKTIEKPPRGVGQNPVRLQTVLV